MFRKTTPPLLEHASAVTLGLLFQAIVLCSADDDIQTPTEPLEDKPGVVETGININPITQIPGIGQYLDTSEGKITSRWYFWLIIGLLSAFFIVLLFFAIRGYRRYRRFQRNAQEEEDKALADGADAASSNATSESKPGDIEMGRSSVGPKVSVDPIGPMSSNGRVMHHKISRSSSAVF